MLGSEILDRALEVCTERTLPWRISKTMRSILEYMNTGNGEEFAQNMFDAHCDSSFITKSIKVLQKDSFAAFKVSKAEEFSPLFEGCIASRSPKFYVSNKVMPPPPEMKF